MPETKKTTKLWEQLLAGVKSAVELRVITYVGAANISGDITAPSVNFDATKGAAIVTSISLVEGDISSVVPDQFWAPEQQVVREFHQAQVDKGAAIVERNLRLIGELGSGLAKAIGELKAIEERGS